MSLLRLIDRTGTLPEPSSDADGSRRRHAKVFYWGGEAMKGAPFFWGGRGHCWGMILTGHI